MATYMRGVRLAQDGIPTYMETLERPKLNKNSRDILVRVHASSVNPADWKIARGDYKGLLRQTPEIPGFDFAGTIVDIGNQVDTNRFQIGQEVFGYSDRCGTYAEYCIVSEDYLARKPKNMSFQDAAALPMVALTAYQSLIHIAQVKEGDNVLILGGGSGVGHIAIQIAKSRGAHVWATCSTEKVDAVKKLGAEPIDYRTTNFASVFAERKLDIVLDVTGIKEDRDRAFDLLRPHGHMITTQPISAAEKPTWMDILGAGASIVWDKTMSALWRNVHYTVFRIDTSKIRDDLDRIRQMVEEGKLHPLVTRTVNLRDVNSAWEQSKDMHTLGKIVIDLEKMEA